MAYKKPRHGRRCNPGTLIILFGGSTKKGQQKAIDQAVALHDEYKARKKALAIAKKGKNA